jgi:hypothetical protein
MTGDQSFYSESQPVSSKSPMNFPYKDTQASIVVACNKTSEWAYIYFTSKPNLNSTETHSGYDKFNTRFKVDDTVGTAYFIQKWGTNTIHFMDEQTHINQFMTGSTVLLELDWHGENGVHFEFSLNGAPESITEMRRQCAALGVSNP